MSLSKFAKNIRLNINICHQNRIGLQHFANLANFVGFYTMNVRLIMSWNSSGISSKMHCPNRKQSNKMPNCTYQEEDVNYPKYPQNENSKINAFEIDIYI